ncbi:MAG: hypothetical protein E5X07_17855 [Mesorhizobium sp.]|uniref:hypothetical protein n=1 Tax=Mesorhizobium sp. TaxID=1871066 RepID=UPI0012143A0E|nr:hypothetical protein [Mesorhizobium sp.]TIR27902.1 MAG: hypothetical protein E5X35_33055 [Mesorhizobium sp.]TIS23078.1 MAG: hypothetical protein E5X07_17855 [Mesorhizobium sp.]
MNARPRPRNQAGLSSALLIAGAVLLFVGTLLHPMHEDPSDALRAFGEYSADHNWLFSHMAQLAGVVAMIAGMLLIIGRLFDGPARGLCSAHHRIWRGVACGCGGFAGSRRHRPEGHGQRMGHG